MAHEYLSARFGRLTRVIGRDDGFVLRIVLTDEIETTLLDPAVEVGGCDPVRRRQQGVSRLEDRYRRFLDSDPITRDLERIRAGRINEEVFTVCVVLHDDRAAGGDIVHQPGMGLTETP